MQATEPTAGKRWAFALLFTWIAFLLSFGVGPASAKGIHATVQAPWTETSLLQEGCEWAARVLGDVGFYRCLEGLAPASADAAVATGARAQLPAAQHDTFVRRIMTPWTTATSASSTSTVSVSPGQRALWEVEMASRVYSPAVAVHYSLAERAVAAGAVGVEWTAAGDVPSTLQSICGTGAPFAVLEGGTTASNAPISRRTYVTEPAAVAEVLQVAASEAKARPRGSPTTVQAAAGGLGLLQGLDHVHPLSAVAPSAAPSSTQDNPSPRDVDPRAPVIVLYGLMGEPATTALYTALLAYMKAHPGEFILVFRHLPVHAPQVCQALRAVLPFRLGEPTAAGGETDAWTARPLFVQGYGATVDLKNMEYKTVDERRVGKDVKGKAGTGKGTGSPEEANDVSDSQEGEFPETNGENGEVGGFNIGVLKQRHPELAVPLDSFASAMEDALGMEETKVDLDAVEASNIALAAAQYVYEAKPEAKLAVLSDLVARFPTYAARLGKLAVQTRRLSHLEEILEHRPFAKVSPKGAIFVDGVEIPEKDISLFGLLERLRAEEEFLDTVRHTLTAKPPTHTIHADAAAAARYVRVSGTAAESSLTDMVLATQDVLRERMSGASAAPPCVAVPLDDLLWLNDLEKKPVLTPAARALSVALQTDSQGRPAFPQRNLMHHVSVLHPADPNTLPYLAQFAQYGEQVGFLRSGFAFLDPDWKATTTAEDVPHTPATWGAAADTHETLSPTSAMVRVLTAVFASIQGSDAPYVIMSFLQALNNAIHARTGSTPHTAPFTAEEVFRAAMDAEVFEAEDATLSDILSDPKFQGLYNRQQSMLRRVGLAGSTLHLPIAFINGRRLLDSASPQSTYRQAFREFDVVRGLIRDGTLRDAMADLYTPIVEAMGCSDHFQPALEPDAMDPFQYDSLPLLDFLHVQPFLSPTARDPLAERKEQRAATRKLPEVIASTATTSVLVIPSHVDVAEAIHLLDNALQAHATPPIDPAEEAAHKRGRKGGDDADRPLFENSGAARFTAVFMENEGSTPTTSRSVQQSVELLLAQDARVMQETGRSSITLRRYVAWAREALEAVEADDSRLRVDDPSSESVLRKRVPIPDELAKLLEVATEAQSKQQGQDSATGDAVAAALRAAFRASVRSQLADATGDVVATTTNDFPFPVLLLNGRAVIIRQPELMGAVDFRFALRQVASAASGVMHQLMALDFAALTQGAGAGNGGFGADDLDASFFAARTAALHSVLESREARRWVRRAGTALGLSEPAREGKVLPPVTEMGGLAFTLEPALDTPGEGRTGARHCITIVVDPAARQSQLLVALAEFFHRSPLKVNVTVYMNPSQQVTRPIRDMFTFVASPTLRFDATSGLVEPPTAVFRALPTQAILTLGIEEPSSWTVFSHEAEYDLDNIILSKLPKHHQFVSAAYRIQSILVAGSALKLLNEGRHAEHANGLPLTLHPLPLPGGDGATALSQRVAGHRSVDTLVMKSVGYYQLQASIGLYSLSVQQGPFAAAYYISGLNDQPNMFLQDSQREEGKAPTRARNRTAGQQIPLLVTTFSGLSLDLYVRAVPANQPPPAILEIAEKEASKSKYTWPPKRGPDGSMDRAAKPARPTLNIFSVASGHLYERFLRMMMYSVFTASSDKYGTNTTRIKFWVIENFLSPQFKAYIPLMAEHFGFEVGFVTYRWPWWLHRQTEKQRKIWAYKILFLDVIFPLDVDRVIFVDADQTDRADLHELYNMDIHNRAIAMAPFCEKFKNEATTGFRFWAQGFWTRHLAGRPYHISAIFLIDLHRFRATGAGDLYRGTYEQLSQDPNSLANLDQDLPNFVQHQVPIYTLPEEWLWCETWCSAKSKAKAKTIDLCNNPLTKMPKLDNAKMVVPKWEETDDMLESLAAKLFAEEEERKLKDVTAH